MVSCIEGAVSIRVFVPTDCLCWVFSMRYPKNFIKFVSIKIPKKKPRIAQQSVNHDIKPFFNASHAVFASDLGSGSAESRARLFGDEGLLPTIGGAHEGILHPPKTASQSFVCFVSVCAESKTSTCYSA